MSQHDSQNPLSKPVGPHEGTTNAGTVTRGENMSRRVADAVAVWLAATGRCIANHDNLFIALLLTLVFYYPSLRNRAQDAGYLYTGDVLGYYLPALIKTHAIIGGGNFDALDFSLFDGSSDFFLSPNFFATHPLVALFCLLWPASDLSVATHRFFLVVMFAAHTLAACYFTLRLARRHFGLELPAGIVAAVTFAFSMYMVGATGQPPFVFSVSVLPWIACTALDYVRDPSWRRLLLAILPVTLALLGGYPPLGAACVGVSLLFVLLRLALADPHPSENRLSDCVLAALPYAAATFLISPLLYAISSFHAETTGSKSGGVHYSAHQLAASPEGIYGGLSAYWRVYGNVHEFQAIWGVVPLLIIAMFIGSRRRLDRFSQRMIVALAAIYGVSLLSMYGDFSVVADMVYYFVPKIGRMHIYQRFLLLTQLAFAIMLALMVQSLAKGPIPRARTAFAVLFVLTMGSGIITARYPAIAETIGINQHFTVELLGGCFLAAAMLVPHRVVLPVTAAILACMPSFDRMYDRSHYGNTLAMAKTRQPLMLDEEVKRGITNYFGTATNKKRIKYVDITPMWSASGIENFPKVFPYYVLDDISLTSFGGFTFYLSARADFMRRVPVQGEAVAVRPDWDLLEASGVDFVVAREEDLTDVALRRRIGVDEGSGSLALPGGARIHPVRFAGAGSAATAGDVETDNGWFRVAPATAAATPDGVNLAFGKPSRQSSTADGPADRAVDGNTQGDHAQDSVTHTGNDPEAWLEIDLGEPQSIGSVRIWGRTDCCQDRLSDYWVLVSETPFPDGATLAELRARPDVQSFPGMKPTPSSTIRTEGTVGRYVRIQLGGGPNPHGTYLSVAECEVFAPEARTDPPHAPRIVDFESNDANWISMLVDAPEPALAQYLLWPNPRSTFYVDGQPVTPTRLNGLAAIPVPAGRHTIEMRYRHWPLRLFWLVYAAYGLSLAVAVLPSWSSRVIVAVTDTLYGSLSPPSATNCSANAVVASTTCSEQTASRSHGLSTP